MKKKKPAAEGTFNKKLDVKLQLIGQEQWTCRKVHLQMARCFSASLVYLNVEPNGINLNALNTII